MFRHRMSSFAVLALVMSLAQAASGVIFASDAEPAGKSNLKTSGSVDVGLSSGMLRGKVCLSGRPGGFTKAFSLNAGLNVARVTDEKGRGLDFDGWYQPGVDGEARVYTLNESVSIVCIHYVGGFPVYTAHDAPLDFKGVIAFNGDSIRAAEQSAWLPFPYDPKTKTRLDSTAFELSVTCAECSFIYVNGSGAQKGTHGTFQSQTPRPAMLFAGTGPFTQTDSVTILNEELPMDEIATLVSTYQRIENYYAEYLGLRIEDKPAILRIIALNQVDRNKRGSEWGFATWPTVALSGSLRPIAKALMNGGELGERRTGYLAHEIGHYYFGTVIDPGGPYHWFLIESTAEFLSLKARGALASTAAERRRVHVLAAEIALEKKAFVALDEISDPNQIDDLYRYNYGPLLLLSLEKSVGEQKMSAFLRGLLAEKQIDSW